MEQFMNRYMVFPWNFSLSISIKQLFYTSLSNVPIFNKAGK